MSASKPYAHAQYENLALVVVLVVSLVGSTQGSGKLYLGEHAPWGSYSQKLAIWTLRRLLTPRANMTEYTN